MIWSVIPEEFLFSSQEAEAAPEQREYLGRQVLVSQGRIVSLLSTCASDYLDDRLAPGAEISQWDS